MLKKLSTNFYRANALTFHFQCVKINRDTKVKGFFIMAKKGVKLGLTYLIAFIASLFLFGFIGWVYIDMLMAEPETGDDTIGVTVEYKPTAADNRTILAAVDYGNKQTDLCLMLIRFLPQTSEAAFLPIPADTLLGTQPTVSGNDSADSVEETFFTAYRDGSVNAVRSAVLSTLGVTVDKFIVFDADSFGNFCDLFGNTTYTITEDILTPAGTVIKAGETYLDRNTMKEVLTYRGYKGGEEERSRRFAEIMSSMLNKELTAPYVSLMDGTFTSLVNSGADTDISRFDYEESYDPLRYTLENTDRFCRSIISSGTRSQSGNYILDPEFITALTVWFEL
jgi:anionic cell wall polymer biosynthesis LytR-Cps2A-Psr (LCP) family protein